MDYNCGMRLYKRKDTGYWYVEIKRDRPKSLGTTDDHEARQKFKILKEELLKGKLVELEKQEQIKLRDFFIEYLKHIHERGLASRTIERTDLAFRKFLNAIDGDRPLRAITINDLAKFTNHCRKIKNQLSTIHIEFRHIRPAFVHATKKSVGYLRHNPFTEYELPKKVKRNPNFIEEVQDIEKVFAAIEAGPRLATRRRYKLIFAIYIYTGARREEIHKIQWGDIGKSYIHFPDRKGSDMLDVPITAKLRAILEEYPQYLNGVGRVVDVELKHMGKRIKYYLRLAGLGNLRPHDLRHTFASHLLMSGVDIKVVQKLLGQSSEQATAIYTHILDRFKTEQISKLPY